MKKSTILMVFGLGLSGLGTLLGSLKDEMDMKEEVRKEVDRQLHGDKEKEESP